MSGEGLGVIEGGMVPPCGEGKDHTHLWYVVRRGGVDPLWKGVVVLGYLSHSQGVSCSTTSHMWGSWYLPRFLLRDGLFTWMYMAPFMVLVTPCASLSTTVKHSKFTWCPVVWLCWWRWDGALRCLLSLSLEILCDSSIYSSSNLHEGI